MGQDNQRVVKTEMKRRPCPDCHKVLEHTVNTVQRDFGKYLLTHTEEICTTCGGKTLVPENKRGSYVYRG